MNYEGFLGQLLGSGELFSPDLSQMRLPSEEPQPEQPVLIPINVADQRGMHNGYLLQSGSLSLELVPPEYAVLIVTKDFVFTHIAKDGRVTTKQDDKLTRLGTLQLNQSSQTLEKNKPFSLGVRYYRRSSIYAPLAAIQDVIIYEHRKIPAKLRRTAQPPSKGILYTPLLRQFLR